MADTILLHVSRGLSDSLSSTPIKNGEFRVTTDTQKAYFDIDSVRIPLGDLVTGLTAAQIQSIESEDILPKLYIASDTNTIYFYDTAASDGAGAWVVAGGDSVSEATNAEFAEKDSSGNVISATYETKSDATSKQTALQNSIDALAARVNDINSFEVEIIDDIANAPVPGASNIVYFVLDDKIAGNTNKYNEYIWVTDQTLQDGGYYENIGTTEADLTNYYTKSEVDNLLSNSDSSVEAIKEDLEAADVALGTRIDNLDTKVDANKLALDNADTAINSRIDTLSQTVTTNKAAADQTQEDLENLDTKVDSIDSAYKAADSALDSKIDALQDDVDTINRFKYTVVSALPTVANAEEYTLYFVPEGNSYAEYMLIEVDESGEKVKKFEKINSDSSLANYYTKSEVDAIKTSLEAGNSANGEAISNLDTHVQSIDTQIADMDSAYKAADSELDGRIDVLEAAMGAYPTAEGTKTVTERLTALESNTTESTEALREDIDNLDTKVDALKTSLEDADSALDARLDTAESDIDNLDTRIADIDTAYKAADTALDSRLTTAESDIDTLEAAVGNYPTAVGTETIATRLDNAESAIAQAQTDITDNYNNLDTRITAIDSAYQNADSELDGRIDVLEAAMGAYPTAEGTKTVTERLATLESNTTESTEALREDIDNLDTKVDSINEALQNADTALDDRLSTVEDAVGNYPTEVGTKTITERLTAAENAITANETDIEDKVTNLTNRVGNIDTAYQAADTAINKRIDDLTTVVGNINKFEIQFFESFEELPEEGTNYTLYFVALPEEDDDNNGKTRYAEYMWIEDPGYYEEVGITEADLTEYYTKNEINSIKTTLENVDTALDARLTTAETDIDNLDTHVQDIDNRIADIDTAYKAADTELDARLDTVEAAIGNYPTEVGTKSIVERLVDAESAITTNEADIEEKVANLDTAYKAADTALASRITTLEEAVGGQGGEGGESVIVRLAQAETDIDNLDTKIDAVDTAFRAADTAISARIDNIDTQIADMDSAYKAADTALDARVTDIETELGTHDWLYAGSSEEGGAATKVVESATSGTGKQNILIGDTDHDQVEYSAKVTMQPSTGDIETEGNVTATQGIFDSIVIGGATVSYDSTTDTLVVEFSE